MLGLIGCPYKRRIAVHAFVFLRVLLEDIEIGSAAKEMWNANFGIIAYDRGVSESPKIQYANKV
jgi:hypothetical protein